MEESTQNSDRHKAFDHAESHMVHEQEEFIAEMMSLIDILKSEITKLEQRNSELEIQLRVAKNNAEFH